MKIRLSRTADNDNADPSYAMGLSQQTFRVLLKRAPHLTIGELARLGKARVTALCGSQEGKA